MKNILSIDVEDYYHVSGLSSVIRRADWEGYPKRVVENTHKILRLLDVHSESPIASLLPERTAPELLSAFRGLAN